MKKTFGKHLKQLRKAVKLTQKQIAKLLLMAASGYASWEQCVSVPYINSINKLKRILDVTLEELIGEE